MKACRLPALQPLPCPEVPEFLSGDEGMQGLVWAKVLCWKGGQDLTNFCHIMCEEGEAMAEFRVRGLAWSPPRGSLASGSQSEITLFTSLSLFLYLWKQDNISFICETEMIIPAYLVVTRIKLNHLYKTLHTSWHIRNHERVFPDFLPDTCQMLPSWVVSSVGAVTLECLSSPGLCQAEQVECMFVGNSSKRPS